MVSLRVYSQPLIWQDASRPYEAVQSNGVSLHGLLTTFAAYLHDTVFSQTPRTTLKMGTDSDTVIESLVHGNSS